MRNKANQSNINNSDPANYPNGRVKNNTGGGDGTPVNEEVYGDFHEMKDKLMRLYGIDHNDLPDNETNGYQFVEALIALASKNDYVIPLTTTDDILRIPVKLGKLKDDESFVLKASADKGTEATIRGTLDNITKNVTYLGSFKENEYVRMINTATGVVLVRMIDSFNLESAVGDLSFLKAATQAEENTGTIITKATTPGRNKVAFAKRVNGTDSPTYLATVAQNGLMSKEHWAAVENITDPTSAIKITSASNIQVTAWQEGNQQDNFNFNYIDVFPPAGKTMANLQGFMASHARIRFDGNVNDDDRMWCQWQEQATKVRLICGASELEEAPRANWLAIWI